MLLLNFAALMSVLIVSTSLPLENSTLAKILEYTFDSNGTGNYEFGYETDNNIFRNETGEIVEDDAHNASLIVRGSYSYVGNNGEKIVVVYVADDKGFRPRITYTFNTTTNELPTPDKIKPSPKANKTSTRSGKKNNPAL